MEYSNTVILITGATGYQGGAVSRQLLQCGFTVRALVCHVNKPAALTLKRGRLRGNDC